MYLEEGFGDFVATIVLDNNKFTPKNLIKIDVGPQPCVVYTWNEFIIWSTDLFYLS